jgi:putative transposase
MFICCEPPKLKKPNRWSGEIRNWNPVKEVYLNPEKQEEKIKENKAA